MHTTISEAERPTEAAAPQYETYASAEVLQYRFDAIMGELLDESTTLHQEFFSRVNIPELHTTPTPFAGKEILLSDQTSHEVVYPNGEQHTIPAFKRLGALIKTIHIAQTRPEVRHLVCSSAGNHGQGVAAAAKEFDMEATIFAASTLTETKDARMRALGANVQKVESEGLADAKAAALAFEAESQDTVAFIDPYEDPYVMAAGGVIMEASVRNLLAQHERGEIDITQTDVLFAAPVGGGGLAAGMAMRLARLKQELGLGDNIQMATVEVEEKGRNHRVDGTCTTTGKNPSLILDNPQYIQERVTVNDAEVKEAERILQGRYRTTAEPAGALAFAGLRHLNESDRIFVVPVTGASVTRTEASPLPPNRMDELIATLGAQASADLHPDDLDQLAVEAYLAGSPPSPLNRATNVWRGK